MRTLPTGFMDHEASDQIGLEYYERTPEDMTHGEGYLDRARLQAPRLCRKRPLLAVIRQSCAGAFTPAERSARSTPCPAEAPPRCRSGTPAGNQMTQIRAFWSLIFEG